MINLDKASLSKITTSEGDNLLELSMIQPVMLIFLRHFGCVFCKEALSDLSELNKFIEQENVKLVFAHLSDDQTASDYFKKYHLSTAISISDPEAHIYKIFGLLKGTFSQVFGLKTWLRTIDAGILNGHGVSRKQVGDPYQMPGIFIISKGLVKSQFIHATVSSRPNYKQLIEIAKSAPA